MKLGRSWRSRAKRAAWLPIVAVPPLALDIGGEDRRVLRWRRVVISRRLDRVKPEHDMEQPEAGLGVALHGPADHHPGHHRDGRLFGRPTTLLDRHLAQ